MRKIRNEELGRKSLSEFKSAPKHPVVLVLDDVRSLNNIGSVFRTADAFLLKGIFLCGITASPPHREIHKTALGAEDSIDWRYFKNIGEALLKLKQDGYTIIVIEQAEGGIPLNEFSPTSEKNYAFVFGNEVQGVSETSMQLADLAIEIPQEGTKHSLNIAVCAGIVVWDYVLKLKLIN